MTSISMPTGRPMDAALRGAGVFQHSRRDAWLLGAALVQGPVVGACVPWVTSRGAPAASAAAALLGFAMVWGSNTVSHNHLHNPLFRRAWQNRAFSVYLSVLLGVPQTIWRARHLHHHAGEPPRRRPMR